jgi:protein disulfide-isomerase
MLSRFQLSGLVAVAAVVSLTTLVHAEDIGVAWRNNLDAAKVEAGQTNRLLLLHFTARWCGPCRVLEQTVLSQPQVGAAVERDYVPVKIDIDASPALANMFRVENVPFEVVLTPQGNAVTTLQAPMNPADYVAQLQNVAEHFRRTTPGAMPGAPPATVNAAYANLPLSASAVQAGAVAGASGSQGVIAQTSATRPQYNPYVTPPAGPASSQAMTPPPTQAAMLGAGGAAGTGASSATNSPEMPANAMPQSYRYGTLGALAGAAPATSGPAGAGGAAASGGSAHAGAITSPPSPANSAYAAVGGAANASGPASAAPGGRAAMAAAQVAAIQPPLPPNCPPVAFDGCCPVTLKALNKWAQGSTTFGAIHRGRTYLFVGETERQQFLADPDSYSPVFAGLDPVLLLDRQQTVAGSRKYGFKYGNAFYLFSCAETRDQFRASPQTYAAGVRQAMAKVDGGMTVRR